MESLLAARELYGVFHPSKKFHIDIEAGLLERLGVSTTLEGHDGCVNTLRWNQAGTLLASASDDRTVRIWGVDGSLATTYATSHTFNIFGVEFLPYGNDRILATGAGDHQVKLHDVAIGEEIGNWTANSRVKRLATAQDEPYLVWSASEDGFIREHDARASTATSIIEAIDEHIKTFAVCQGRTELVAVGVTSYVVPIYDRRNPKEPLLMAASADQMCSGTIGRFALYPTHVAFDYYGRELLVNQNGGGGGGNIFLFDLQSGQQSVTMDKLNLILSDTGEQEPESRLVTDVLTADYAGKAKEFMTTQRYSEAVIIYSEAVHHCTYPIWDVSFLYERRAMAYLARRKPGDVYASVRDNIEAVLMNPRNRKALWRLIKGFLLLEQWDVASEVIDFYKKRFPNDKSIERLSEQLAAGLLSNKRQITSMRANNCCDYQGRFVGHTNLQTDIKEANFFGSENQYIVAGSDCGSMIIWDKTTGNLKTVFHADDDILNIVQPHPQKFMVASSGIEKVIRFWEPLPEGTVEERRMTYSQLTERSQQPRQDVLVLVNALMRMQHGQMRRVDRDDGDDDNGPPGCAVQ